MLKKGIIEDAYNGSELVTAIIEFNHLMKFMVAIIIVKMVFVIFLNVLMIKG